MKTRVLLPFLILAGLILAVGLACGTNTPTVQPTTPPPVVIPPTNLPTQQIQPTVAVPTVAAPTPTTKAPAYFTENQFADLSNWSYFLMKGDKKKMTIKGDSGILKFDLEAENIWVYLTYDPYFYKDVRLDARAENRGKNNNNVSLICRYSSDEGWYEFNIANSGLYSILAYAVIDKAYHTIYSGGSTAIKEGKDVNDYTAICQGYTLSLYINGVEVRTIDDDTYHLRQGKIGIGVSSFDALPVIIEWDSITVSQP